MGLDNIIALQLSSQITRTLLAAIRTIIDLLKYNSNLQLDQGSLKKYSYILNAIKKALMHDDSKTTIETIIKKGWQFGISIEYRSSGLSIKFEYPLFALKKALPEDRYITEYIKSIEVYWDEKYRIIGIHIDMDTLPSFDNYNIVKSETNSYPWVYILLALDNKGRLISDIENPTVCYSSTKICI